MIKISRFYYVFSVQLFLTRSAICDIKRHYKDIGIIFCQVKERSVGGLLEAVRNGAGRSKFKLTHNELDRQPLSAKPIWNNGQLSLSNTATLANATLSSNNVGRIIAFKGLFAVQWRDARSMPLRREVERWRGIYTRISRQMKEWVYSMSS